MKNPDRATRLLGAGVLFVWGLVLVAIGVAIRVRTLHADMPIFYTIGFVVCGAACLLIAAFVARAVP